MAERAAGFPKFEMEFPANAESIALVREAVASEADRLGMSRQAIGDLKTIATEAVTNAVLYAYADEVEGSVVVAMTVASGELSLTVRDFGDGIIPKPQLDVPSLSMGLPIIGALASGFDLSTNRGGGTELVIRMPLTGAPRMDD